MVSSNGMFSTQGSTTPTMMGKGGKRIPAYIKGIATNQKQLESKKKEPDTKQGSSAFNLIQQRIKDTQAQQNEQFQTTVMNTMNDEYGQEDYQEEIQNDMYNNQNVIVDNDENNFVNDQSAINQNNTSLQEHSQEFEKIQNHLMMKIGASENKNDYPEEIQQQISPEHVMVEGLGIDDMQYMHSERIEHNNVDGAIRFLEENANAKYINQENVIQEEIDENESVTKADSVEIQIDIEGIDDVENDDILDDDEGDDDVVLFIEYKYCTICHIEQPLRCKHCKTCDHCVSTYDHHCPWIGNCVGERNKCRFFCFLLFQFIQLVIGMFICSQVLIWNSKDDELLTDSNQLIILFLFLLTIGFTLFVTPLLVFQCYLIL